STLFQKRGEEHPEGICKKEGFLCGDKMIIYSIQKTTQMLARHRLISFPIKQYHRIWNVVQCPFVAIHSIRFPSHGHEVGIGNIDVKGKFFGGWTNSLWIQDAVGFNAAMTYHPFVRHVSMSDFDVYQESNRT
ncbi:hypothetical protein, partial [Aeribacillus composti]|uniref:hypothetical protein n=1 Tax=Aeribacillus composti TaxID=1868734 RepID=UPI001A7E36C0